MPYHREHDLAAALFHAQDAPPLWDRLGRFCAVIRRHDQRDEVERLTVNGRLKWKPAEAVTSALDLVTVEIAVYGRHVYSGDTLTQPEFLDDDGVRLSAMLTSNPLIKVVADIDFSHLDEL